MGPCRQLPRARGRRARRPLTAPLLPCGCGAAQVNRMLSFALNSKRLKDKLMDTSALIAEVCLEL
mgnify:CR=1 FL=1